MKTDMVAVVSIMNSIRHTRVRGTYVGEIGHIPTVSLWVINKIVVSIQRSTMETKNHENLCNEK